MPNTPPAKVEVNYVTVNDSPEAMIRAFVNAATKQGFDKGFIDRVVSEAGDDYGNVIRTLRKYSRWGA